MESTSDDESNATPVAEHTYRTLRQAIREGEFASGDRLTGAGLAKRLGVSRTPVRTALLRLEAEGLVESEDGRAARVRPLTVTDVEHAYDVAEGLESVVAARLATHASDDEIDLLTEAAAEMERAATADDRHRWVAADERFHHLLAEFAQNPLLTSMMARVDNVIGRVRFLSLHLYPDGAALSAGEHRAVTDAIRDRNGERARTVHQSHWVRVRETNIVLLRESFATLGPIQPI